MEIKRTQLVVRGMQQDLSISKFNPEFSYENRNIRITAREDSSLLSITNERGNKIIEFTDAEDIKFTSFKGTCIGYASLNSYIILFTHSEEDKEAPDRIYRIENLDKTTLMFEGNLNFSLDHLIETLPVYESEGVQKVYWTDSYNQPRVINFMNDPEPEKWGETTYYDFSPSMDPYSFIDVEKNSTGGQFAPGVIQYAFTYITDWHGVESNIVDTSSLNYISYDKRAAKEDETCYNSFSIRLSGLDARYKYVRIYSIHRTSLDTTPTVKILGEYEILKPEGDPVEYQDLRKEILTVVENLQSKVYKPAWYDELPKLDPEYDSFADAINSAFDVNISTVGNGIFTLQEVFEYIWKQKSNYVEVVDTGVVGVNEDPTSLLYKNASRAIINTMAVKDATLFVGGYTIPNEVNEDERPKSIRIYKEYGTTVVPISWWVGSHSGKKTLDAGPDIFLQNGVASDVKLKVLWNDNIVPKTLTITKGSTVGWIEWDATSAGVESIEIIKKNEGDAYYSDFNHIYYLKGVDSYPSDPSILDGAGGTYRWGYRDYIPIEDSTDIGTYTYTPYTLNKGAAYCKQFKKGQPYRFALQGQYANGRWGDPILIENLEDVKSLYESGSSLEEKDAEQLLRLDNVCTTSFLIDSILSQEITPQYTLTDIVTTKPSTKRMSNLIEDTTVGYFTKETPPLADSFWYFPINCYPEGQDANEIWYDTDLYSIPNPWRLIYNKDTVINSGGNLEEISLRNTAAYVNFKTNYSVNGELFFSLWAGNLQRPQTQSRFCDSSISRSHLLPFDAGKAVDIPNNTFKGGVTTLYLNKLSITLSAKKCTELYEKYGYRRVRLLYVVPTKTNRKYPAQGIVTNTVFLPKQRASNSCWAYTDYLSRPKEVYRVYNEFSGFFKTWTVRVGDIRLIPDNSSSWTQKALRFTGHPYFYPFIHRFYTDYGNGSPDSEWNKVWNMRPNYGHMMTTFHETGSTSERNITSNGEFFNTDSTSESFTYDPTVQYMKEPHLTLNALNNDLDGVYLDESIMDFWSPDIEYQEVDKNYFENTVEGFQVRGMSCVVSTTNSNYKLKEDGTTYGLLGYSDAQNYYPFQDLVSLENKNFSVEKYTNNTTVKFLTSPQFGDISAGVHRFYLTGLGTWTPTGDIYPHMWEDLGCKEDALTSNKRDKDSQFSYKKYCLNTLMFRDLNSLFYRVNQPSLFIKGDTINSISLYKTAYSGESVTYNPGMDELLFKADTYNIPIQYKANTHLTFSLAKGETLLYNNDTGSKEDERAAFPIIPELSAYAKYHEGQQVLGRSNGNVIYINLYWWPSKDSFRPDIYRNETYRVTESINKGYGQAVWQIALESNVPLPVDITVEVSYRLGFWKSGKTSQLGRTSITLPQGQRNAHKNFKEDFTTFRNWSTIEVQSREIVKVGTDKNPNIHWTIQDRYAATNDNPASKDVIILVNNNTYINPEELTNSDPFWLGKIGLYAKDVFDPIQEEILAPEYDNVGIQSIIWHRNLPHFLLIDLVRSDAFIYSDWNESGLYQQVWIPCGKPTVLPIPDSEKPQSCIVEATEGDVFVGRYDCLRTASDSDKIEKVNDIVSFICESYVNPDGRADVNRYNTDTRAMNFDNWNVWNPVYSQANNFFNYTKNDYRVLEHSGQFPNQFSWTLPKYPDSLVDNWTNLTFASTYNLDGEYGKLTKIVAHNNQLYAFQDKAISNILYNTRVQIPVSDGLPVELANSNKVDGVRYISTTSGAQNKWSIITNRSGIYYIDHAKKNLNLISSEGIKEVTGVAHFTKWALNNLGYSTGELSLTDGMTNWKLSRDSIHDDVYIHDKNECLVFSERLAAFTSFFDYKNVPFMFRQDGQFLSIYSEDDTTSIYQQNAGIYNQFFDKPKVTSYIDYIVNPEMSRDKVFNNIEFRADAFTLENDNYSKYVPNRTLDHIHVRNEFQDTGDVTLKQYKNLQKKFRMWRAYIPRDVKEVENYQLNRIRNPWIQMKLSYTPTELEDNKLVMHDLIVNYTV